MESPSECGIELPCYISHGASYFGYVARMEEGRSAFKILTKGKRPLGRPRRRWEDIIRMDLKEICINIRNLVHSSQNRGC